MLSETTSRLVWYISVYHVCVNLAGIRKGISLRSSDGAVLFLNFSDSREYSLPFTTAQHNIAKSNFPCLSTSQNAKTNFDATNQVIKSVCTYSRSGRTLYYSIHPSIMTTPSTIASLNNNAAELIERGQFVSAVSLLSSALQKAQQTICGDLRPEDKAKETKVESSKKRARQSSVTTSSDSHACQREIQDR